MPLAVSNLRVAPEATHIELLRSSGVHYINSERVERKSFF